MSTLPEQQSGTPISAAFLNSIISAVVKLIVGGRGIVVRRANNQVVIERQGYDSPGVSVPRAKWIPYNGA
jgi:hypothetical protein